MTAVQYLHHTPGRLRVKSRRFQQPDVAVRKALVQLQALAGVHAVRLNPRAGSLTVHYDPARHGQSELLSVLETAGCLRPAARVQTAPAARTGPAREGVTDLFGKALLGALAQRTAARLIGALL